MDYTLVTQVLPLDALSTAMICYYLANMPMIDRTNNFIQVFNEVVILIAIWSMFLFTDYVADPSTRLLFGEGFKFTIIFNVIVNLAILVYTVVSQIIQSIKKCH